MQRKILLYTQLSDALKHFRIVVTEEEKREEKEVLAPSHATRAVAHVEETINQMAAILATTPAEDAIDDLLQKVRRMKHPARLEQGKAVPENKDS